jgi:uncharacterized protein YjgD (DUF1641 family)
MAVDAKTNEKWERFLSPEHMRKSLAQVGVFLCAYEMLKTQTVKQLEDFYSDGFAKNVPIISEEYKSRVLEKSKSVFVASQLWLLESEAISQEDITVFEFLRKARNSIAHELPDFLSDTEKHDLSIYIKLAAALIHKIDNWWFVNVELSVNPVFDDLDIDTVNTAEVQSGTSIMLTMLEQVALADSETAAQYLNAWKAKSWKSTEKNDPT